jgi:GT2 family glycosyltransferase
VTVNYNGGAYIGACLGSLRLLSRRPDVVVVVDNASRDGSPDIIARDFPEVVLIRNETNAGFSGGTNIGIRRCLEIGIDAVLLLNPDTVVDPAALEALVAAAERHPGALLAPAIYYQGSPDISNSYVGEIVWWRGRTDTRYLGRTARKQPAVDERVGTANGCCLFVPSTVLNTVGLFDEDYFLYFEDVDFIERARRAGYEVWYVPTARILHQESSATGGRRAPLVMYYFVRNRHHFVRKFQRRTMAYSAFVAYSLADIGARVIWFLLLGRPALARAVIRGALDGFTRQLGPYRPQRI